MPVRVADAKVLTPAPENRVERPKLVLETVEVVISHRTTDLLAHALHRRRGWPPIAVESLRIAPHRLQPEAHPEEVKPVRGVDDARLFRVQAHPQAVHDPLHPLKPRLPDPRATHAYEPQKRLGGPLATNNPPTTFPETPPQAGPHPPTSPPLETPPPPPPVCQVLPAALASPASGCTPAGPVAGDTASR